MASLFTEADVDKRTFTIDPNTEIIVQSLLQHLGDGTFDLVKKLVEKSSAILALHK